MITPDPTWPTLPSAGVAEILADVEFRTKVKKAVEGKDGARRVAEPSPTVQVRGRRSSGSPPVDASPQDKDVVMDSVDVQIPLTDGTHAAATASHPAPMSATGTKSGRDGDEDFEDGQVARVLATTSVGLKRGRRDSSSSTSSSSSSSTSQENAHKIDEEGETVMRHPAFSEEYKFRHLGEGSGKAMNFVKPVNNLSMA